MKTYTVHSDYHAQEISIIERLRLSELVDTQKFDMRQAWINVGGWQSWNPGFEVAPGKRQPSLISRIIKGWNNYLVFPNSNFKPGKDCILGQFVAYLRWDEFYLVFASVGNVTFFSCTVESMNALSVSSWSSFTRTLSLRMSSMPDSPMRLRNATSSVGVHGTPVWSSCSPQKYW